MLGGGRDGSRSDISSACLGGVIVVGRLFDLGLHIVVRFFVFITLLVCFGFLFIRAALDVSQGLPALTEELADLTERNAWILLTNIVTLLVGEEHVGRQATLRGIRVLLLALILDAALATGGLFLRHVYGNLVEKGLR